MKRLAITLFLFAITCTANATEEFSGQFTKSGIQEWCTARHEWASPLKGLLYTAQCTELETKALAKLISYQAEWVAGDLVDMDGALKFCGQTQDLGELINYERYGWVWVHFCFIDEIIGTVGILHYEFQWDFPDAPHWLFYAVDDCIGSYVVGYGLFESHACLEYRIRENAYFQYSKQIDNFTSLLNHGKEASGQYTISGIKSWCEDKPASWNIWWNLSGKLESISCLEHETIAISTLIMQRKEWQAGDLIDMDSALNLCVQGPVSSESTNLEKYGWAQVYDCFRSQVSASLQIIHYLIQWNYTDWLTDAVEQCVNVNAKEFWLTLTVSCIEQQIEYQASARYVEHIPE